jgi:hypothetical protein
MCSSFEKDWVAIRHDSVSLRFVPSSKYQTANANGLINSSSRFNGSFFTHRCPISGSGLSITGYQILWGSTNSSR